MRHCKGLQQLTLHLQRPGAPTHGITFKYQHSRSRVKAKSAVTFLVRAISPGILLAAIVIALSCDVPPVQAGTTNYTYDELGRLQAITYSNGTSTSYSLDAAGNRKNVVTLLDTTAPTIPSGLTATVISQSQLNLAWGASTDAGTGLGGYYVIRNGSNVKTVNASTTTYQDTGLGGFATYTYAIEAFDLASPPNVSVQSATASATTPDQTPPTTPTLTATAASQTQINLSWSGSTDSGGSGMGGYKIFRNGSGTALVTLGPSVTTYSDPGLAGYTSYSYTVQAFDNATPTNNLSALSNTATATTPDQTPPTVVTVSATAVSSSQVNLSWTTSTDAGGSLLNYYKITRNGTALPSTIPAGTTTTSDTSVGGGTTYNYTVIAYDHALNPSPISNTASVTTPIGAPTTPGQPTPNGVIETASPWVMSWSASTGAVTYYVLNQNNGSTSNNITVNAPATSASVAGANGISYTFTVKACNSSNVCSAFSAGSEVTYCRGGTCP
jgi:YD repeat-containing protein